MIEVNIGIWCASIPALKALITHRRRGDTQASGAYKYHSRDKSGAKISGGMIGGSGGSSSARSQGMPVDIYDLKTFEETGSVQSPQQAVRKKSNVDSEWSADSQERIIEHARV